MNNENIYSPPLDTIEFFRRVSTEKEIDIHIWNKPKTSRHGHDFYEFAVCTKGRLINWLNDSQKQYVDKKQAFFITPDDVHTIVTSGKDAGEHINISFTPTMFNQICEFLRIPPHKTNFAKLITMTDAEYDQITGLISDYFIRHDEKKSNETEGFANFIAANLVLVFFNHSTYSDNIPKWLIDFTNLLHMEKNIASPISELYYLSGYSQTSLSKAFRKYYGTTLVDFFNHIKIQYAYNLLKNTNLKIISIASMVGFDSLSHFNHLFKKITNLTPSEVRSNTNYN